MDFVYKKTDDGDLPASVSDAKNFMKLPPDHPETALIQTMIATATAWGESYTAREFRENTYELTFDCFPTRIPLARDPVKSVASITYFVGGAKTTVPSETYYLKKNISNSEILLSFEKSWPTDGDETTQCLEGSIVVTFTTEPVTCDGSLRDTVLRHVSSMFFERGDCTVSDAAESSGAVELYNMLFKSSRSSFG